MTNSFKYAMKKVYLKEEVVMREDIETIKTEIEKLGTFGTKNITESEVLNRAFLIKPITIIPQGQGAGLITDGPYFLNAQAIDLQLDPLDLKQKAGVYEHVGTFTMSTPIGFGHYGRIQPTIAQVLAQIPEEYLGKANAFMFDKPLYTDEHRLVMLDAKTKLFGMQYDIHLYKADLPKEIKEQEVIYKGQVYQALRHINGQESKMEPENTTKTFPYTFEAWLDEDIQDDVYVPGITEHIHRAQTIIDEINKLLHPTTPQVQKITDQQTLPIQDTSRGAREE